MQRVIKVNVFNMVANFQKLDLETLVDAADKLMYRILSNITEKDGKQEIDTETLCELLEDFGGRDYIVHMKLENDLPLSQEDKDYLKEILNKRAS